MRYRVERVRTDHGYGDGWVVLDEFGDYAGWQQHWAYAFEWAQHLVRSWSAVS